MASDIVVNLRAGTHTLTEPPRLSDTVGDSGRNGHEVIYQAYGYGTSSQENVTLSGGREVITWRPDPQADGVWQAEVGDLETRQLYVDGRRADRAPRGAGLPGGVVTTDTGYVTDSTLPQSWRDPQDMEFVWTTPFWAEGRCGVADITGDERQTVITMDQPCWRLARSLYEEGGDGTGEPPEPLAGPTSIENSPSFLGQPGSWYLDRSRPGHHMLLYVPRDGEDMRDAQVVAPVLETVVDGTGHFGSPLHDITFRGLTFAHATWLEPSTDAGFVSAWSMYKRPDQETWLTVPGNVRFRTAKRITLEGNRFVHLGAQTVEFSESSSDIVVEGNEITDVSDGGILMGVVLPDTEGTNRGNRITDNLIHHVGVEYRGASGIWTTATQDTTVAHNQVNDVPYTGILSGPNPDLRNLAQGNRIIGNRVFDTNLVLSDGGGIYLRGDQGSSYADGAVLSGNAVTNEGRDLFSIGLYTDDTTNWATVLDNAVFGYPASIGGCDELPDRPVSNIRYTGNFWDDALPEYLERRPIPGAWPCGDPHDVTFEENTRLPTEDPAQACAANAACAAILDNAGPRAPYREPFGLD